MASRPPGKHGPGTCRRNAQGRIRVRIVHRQRGLRHGHGTGESPSLPAALRHAGGRTAPMNTSAFSAPPCPSFPRRSSLSGGWRGEESWSAPTAPAHPGNSCIYLHSVDVSSPSLLPCPGGLSPHLGWLSVKQYCQPARDHEGPCSVTTVAAMPFPDRLPRIKLGGHIAPGNPAPMPASNALHNPSIVPGADDPDYRQRTTATAEYRPGAGHPEMGSASAVRWSGTR